MTKAEPGTLSQEQAARNSDLADVLDVLIRLHDREADAELLCGLRDTAVADWIGDIVTGDAGKSAARHLGEVLAAVPDPVPQDYLDDLAAEFSDISLTHGYRISPSGSVWLTEDHLERQMPMFDVRGWYAHYDMTVPNWRVRADDHLVHELQFISFLLHLGDMVPVTDAARFMDLHVLPWVPAFCTQGRPRLRRGLYQALFDLTVAVLDDVRDVLEAQTGLPRDVYQPTLLGAERVSEEETAYVPGVSESW